MGGFGSHLHNTFCIHCTIQKEDLQIPDRYDPDGELFLCATIYFMSSSILAFSRRTEQEHRQLAAHYAQIRSYTTREMHFSQHATRFTQLSHLPHFPIVARFKIERTRALEWHPDPPKLLL